MVITELFLFLFKGLCTLLCIILFLFRSIVDLLCCASFRNTAKWFSYIYITNAYILFQIFSIIGHYKILNIVPCTMQ